MLVTIIPNFALFSYFTTDRFHYQLYGHLARFLKTHEGIGKRALSPETTGATTISSEIHPFRQPQ